MKLVKEAQVYVRVLLRFYIITDVFYLRATINTQAVFVITDSFTLNNLFLFIEMLNTYKKSYVPFGLNI